MKLLSWNVNGIRAVLKKLDLQQIVQDLDLDTLCLQEVKAEAEQVDFDIPGYQKFWHHSIVKKRLFRDGRFYEVAGYLLPLWHWHSRTRSGGTGHYT